MDKGAVLQRAKAAYVGMARLADRGLTRVGLLDGDPPPRDHRIRHWVHTLTKVHDSNAMADMDVPWWTYRAIDVVEEWLGNRHPQARVFEYGSGASTLWLSRRAAHVDSVEHFAPFAASMRPRLAEAGNVDLHVVEARRSANPEVPSAKEGHAGLDFADYVATIDKVGGQFDLIVVDGRAREACLVAALPHLAPDGIIVFDNSWRRRYRTAITAAPVVERRLRGLTPTLPYPDATSILTLRT